MPYIEIDDLQGAIEEILRGYGDVIYQATEEGLSAAEKVLIDELKAASPEGLTKDFKKAWKGKGKKYKLRRYVGNTKMVKGKKGNIPLSNILEYSEKSKHQGFMKRTFENSIDKMAAAVVAEIKKEA